MALKQQRILVVDDEVKIVEAVKSYLESSGFTVFHAFDCAQAQKVMEQHTLDLMILDLMLPDMSGEDFCRQIRQSSRLPIIMLTAKAAETDLLKGLDIGADDYMTKPFSVRELLARVHALLRRSAEAAPVFNTMIFKDQDLVIENQKHEVRKGGTLVNLTPNEYKILMTLIAYPNRVFTREELIVAALGSDYEGFDRTVDSHIKNLRQKIETDTKNPVYILTIHGFGYKFGGV